MDRLYCTIAELMDDLTLAGVKNEESLLKHIRSASQFVEQQLGQFLPRWETLKFSACGAGELLVPPLLSITSITSDGNSLSAGTDYVLKPFERHWRNGPYSQIWLYQYGYFSILPEGVVIQGKWGLYDDTLDLAMTVSAASSSGTSLAVPDGSKCSAGMVLMVESEQMLVQGTGAATDSTADLNGALDDQAEEFAVTDGTKIKTGEVIKVDFECMKVLDIQTNQVLTARGWNESRRASHLTGAQVNVLRTFTVKRGANGTTAATHTNAEVFQQVAPADVNYLARQVAALMKKKADTGFMGRSGNDDLGTGFWVNEFPKNQVEVVKSNYFWGGR